MPIYTRTGDKGQTSLFNKQRVPKFHIRVEAYGTIDELNSSIGLVISEIKNSKGKSQKYSPRSSFGEAGKSKLKSELTAIQNDLLEVGSTLANPDAKPLEYLSQRVVEFEHFIDEMTGQIPILKNFILPGGGKAGVFLQFSRTVSRRAERRVVELADKEDIDSNIVIYMNRLSDLLFTMARFVNFKEKRKEIIWFKKIV